MNDNNQVAVLWRRKWTVLITTIVVVAVTIGISKTLTPVYSTTATLIVAQPGSTQTFDLAQATEEAARSFAQVISGTDFARTVAADVGHGATAQSISSATTIQSVTNTELITITAEDPSPTRAQTIANTYARVFVAFAPQLTPQTKATVTLANHATVPTSPVRPKPMLYAVAALLIGLAAGVGLAFLRERLDARVHSAEDIARLVDAPILATIPRRTGPDDAAFTESFRMLRSTLRFSDQHARSRRIVITSWSEAEGKTTVSHELALVIGVTGGRNILVDGDVHRAGLHRRVDPGIDPHERPGFVEYIVGAAPADRCLYDTSIREVKFMPPGRTVTSLSNLLESPSGAASFARLEADADLVIVDSPPLAASADASSLAAKADGVVLVVDLEQATTAALRHAVEQLRGVGAHIIGLVINRDHRTPTLDYYGYGTKDSEAPGRRLGRRRRGPGKASAEQPRARSLKVLATPDAAEPDPAESDDPVDAPRT